MAARLKKIGPKALSGGVAQLGEHLPCKQGVKSSNLSVSSAGKPAGGKSKTAELYLENRILNEIKESPEGDCPTGQGTGRASRKIETSKAAAGRRKRDCCGEKKSKKKTGNGTLSVSGGSSKEEHREDALALRAEERRDKLRKAAGRSTYPEIRRYLNGETHLGEPQVSIHESIVYGGEPGELKHLSSRRKRKQK